MRSSGDPHWSPDGRSVAFTSHADGNSDIFMMRCEQNGAACAEPRQLTQKPGTDANPTWSVDGRWIYSPLHRSGGYEVWRMPADGIGEPERITWNGGYIARESADQKWLYYPKSVNPAVGFWRIPMPLRGPGRRKRRCVEYTVLGRRRNVGAGRAGAVLLSVDRRSSRSVSGSASDRCRNGPTRDLPVGNISLSRGLSLSPDGRWLLRSQIDRALTHIMIAE